MGKRKHLKAIKKKIRHALGIVAPFDVFVEPYGYDRCVQHGEALASDERYPYCPSCRAEAALTVEIAGDYGTTLELPYSTKGVFFVPGSASALEAVLTDHGYETEIGRAKTRQTRPPIASGPNKGKSRSDLVIDWTYITGKRSDRAVIATYRTTSFESANVVEKGAGQRLVTLKGELDSWIEEGGRHA